MSRRISMLTVCSMLVLGVSARSFAQNTASQPAGGQPTTPQPATPPAGVAITPAPAPAVDPRTRFAGVYLFAGGAREQEGIQAGIERAIDEMSFITRPFARSRLRNTNPAYGWVQVQFQGEHIVITLAGRSPINTLADGSPAPWTRPDGEQVQARQRFMGDRVVQSITAQDGSRRVEYQLDASGQRLTLDVTVTSPRLPAPLRYRLTYRRR